MLTRSAEDVVTSSQEGTVELCDGAQQRGHLVGHKALVEAFEATGGPN